MIDRTPYKPMTQEEIAKRDPEVDARRLGAKAFHHGHGIETCPHPETDLLNACWRDGYTAAKKRPRGCDGTEAEDAGRRAFHDGLRPEDCPYHGRKQPRQWSEWHARYNRVKEANERREAELYR
jgi:hypothetical protein